LANVGWNDILVRADVSRFTNGEPAALQGEDSFRKVLAVLGRNPKHRFVRLDALAGAFDFGMRPALAVTAFSAG
jgi:hypothetical protein